MTLVQPPIAVDSEELREKIARIIDGLAFGVTGDPATDDRRALQRASAFAKADAILALSAPPVHAEPVAWRYAHRNTPTDWRVTDHDIGKDWPNLIVQPRYDHPASGEDVEGLRSLIYSATHAVLPLASDEAGMKDRARQQVEIADHFLAALSNRRK